MTEGGLLVFKNRNKIPVIGVYLYIRQKVITCHANT